MRDGPCTTNTNILGTQLIGEMGYVLSGPITQCSYTWWQVRWGDTLVGWSADGSTSTTWLTKVSIDPSTKFSINDNVKASTGGGNLVTRYDPTGLAFKANIPDNTQGTVIAGPIHATLPGLNGFYDLWKINWDSTSGWSAENYLTKITTTVPSPPRNLQATAGDTVVNLNWDPPSNNGGSAVTNYKIYRGTTPGGETLYYTTQTAGTTFSNTNVVNGVTYYYKVKAVNSIGDSDYSNEDSATPQSIQTKPNTPNPLEPGTVAEPGQEISTLTPTFRWTSISDADYYKIYISKYPYGPSNIIYSNENVNTNSLVLPGGYLADGLNYRWDVGACNEAGCSDQSSNLYFYVNIQTPAGTFIWPVGSYQVTQDYGCYNCIGNNKYHTGKDIIGDQQVVASGDGTVILIQPNDVGCAGPGTGDCDDHGLGNTIILKHSLTDSSTIYTQYSHLDSFSSGLTVGKCVQKGAPIGVMGGSGYGQRYYYSVHLHFEVKNQPVIGAPTAPGSYWGYTTSHPDSYGYIDPSNIIGVAQYKSCTSDGRVDGIDVSHWQGDINWNSVYGDGYRFAFAKASEGDDYVDPKFTTNMVNGKNAGMLMGAYHFARPDLSSASVEAQHFINVISPYLTEEYLRPALDLETGSSLGKTALSNWVHEFVNTVKTQTGVVPIIYINNYYANNYLDNSINQYDLWIAHWTYDPNTPPNTGIWSNWDFWQYSDQGSVPGITGNVDLDLFNGDMAMLNNYLIVRNLFNFPLVTGWNLISLPLSPQNKAVEQVFSSIDGNYAVIYIYNSFDVGNEWKSYDPNRPSFLNSLKEVNETLGIWVYMLNPSTLTITGNINNNVIFYLKQGWNLIGYPSLTEQPVADALSEVSGEYLVVYEYVAVDVGNEWKSYDPARPEFLNTLKNFTPGYGYWVKAVSNTGWRFDRTFKKI